jgi:hypothetical protein
VAAVVVDLVGGEKAARALVKAAGKVAGGALGGVACAAVSAGTRGVTAVSCVAAIYVGSELGEQVATGLFELLTSRGKIRRGAGARRR